MIRNSGAFLVGLAAVAALMAAPVAHAAPLHIEPLTDWTVQTQVGNPPTTSDLNTNSPVFDTRRGDSTASNSPATAISVMADFGGMFPFGDEIKLLNDGDYVKASLTLSITDREAFTGAAGLNVQLQTGLFKSPSGNVGVNDGPHSGVVFTHSNTNNANWGSPGPRVDERNNAQDPFAAAVPFVSPQSILIGNGSGIAPGDTIQGASTGDYYFELMLTRNGNNLDVAGGIRVGNSAGAVLTSFAIAGYAPTNLADGNGDFVFNRLGFLLGNQVRGVATLGDVLIETNVPEPSAAVLALAAVASVAAIRRRGC